MAPRGPETPKAGEEGSAAVWQVSAQQCRTPPVTAPPDSLFWPTDRWPVRPGLREDTRLPSTTGRSGWGPSCPGAP